MIAVLNRRIGDVTGLDVSMPAGEPLQVGLAVFLESLIVGVCLNCDKDYLERIKFPLLSISINKR